MEDDKVRITEKPIATEYNDGDTLISVIGGEVKRLPISNIQPTIDGDVFEGILSNVYGE